MISRYLFVCIIVVSTLISKDALAQLDEIKYTYVSENQFLDIKELENFTFIPNKVDIKKSIPVSIKSKNLRIHIAENKIHFAGISDLDSYSIISKSYSSTGFDYMLNLGNLEFEPAYLKVVIDDDHHVHLIYLYSDEHGSFTFYLPYKSDDIFKKDEDHFTTKSQIKIKDYDSILDRRIYPYHFAKDGQVYNKQKIKRHAHLSFYFDKDRFAFSTQKESTFNEIRKDRKYKVKIPNMPRITHCIELTAESGYKDCHIYIDKYERISVIEYEGNLYFLLP